MYLGSVVLSGAATPLVQTLEIQNDGGRRLGFAIGLPPTSLRVGPKGRDIRAHLAILRSAGHSAVFDLDGAIAVSGVGFRMRHLDDGGACVD